MKSSAVLLAALAVLSLGCTRGAAPVALVHQAPNPSPSAAYVALELALEATARDVDRQGARPPIIAREVSMYVTAMYDAWAAYDAKAAGTRLGARLRRPEAERTDPNRERAIAFAVHRVLESLYPDDRAWLDEAMRARGLDPSDRRLDPSSPSGVGNLAAAALLTYRRHDGSNQFGDEPGAEGPYADTTHYAPKNPVDRVVDPDRWQPIPFADGKGGVKYPGFLTPHWGTVKPFALERPDQFRPPPPPKVGSEQMERDLDEVIALNGHLSLEQKAIVEFMRDGPRSTGQSGHWLRFAQDVARRDPGDLGRDVKLFFAVGNVTFDAFIACWEAKAIYDSSRPWLLVRHLRAGKTIDAYAGSCQGFARLPAEQWHPYSPPTFVTPPFPGYPSGHSTASGAGSKMLELFTGSDRFDAVALRTAGELTEVGCDASAMQARDGVPEKKAGGTAITLRLPTFSSVAEMAGQSRIMGGYHIQADNLAGLALGRSIATWSWPRYQAYFEGTAKDPGDPLPAP